MSMEFGKNFRFFSGSVIFTDGFSGFEVLEEFDVEGVDEHCYSEAQ